MVLLSTRVLLGLEEFSIFSLECYLHLFPSSLHFVRGFYIDVKGLKVVDGADVNVFSSLLLGLAY